METVLIILVVLKLCGLISLSWFWILGPVGVLCLIGMGIVLVSSVQT